MEEYHKFKREFQPLNIAVRNNMQVVSALLWHVTIAFGGVISVTFTLYLLFSTKLWWVTIAYIIWIYIDRHTCETGGRRHSWMQSCEYWEYFRNYFPIRLHRLPWTQYEPSKNYLFCFFPHGLLTPSAFSIFLTEQGEFSEYFPGLKPYLCMNAQYFHIPFFRELLLSMGACSPSARSLDRLLGDPKGANAVGLVVGGAEETEHYKPGQYKLVLKNRKEFVKAALRNGCSLVPVISFGETEIFDRYSKGESSFFKTCQEKLKKLLDLAPFIPIERGVLHDSFSLLPHRRCVNVIAGAPIAVKKTEDPKPSEIDDLHKIFCDELLKLFESQKYNYIEDAKDIHLEFV